MSTFSPHAIRNIASFEARVFVPGSQFFRGGLAPALADFQYYTTRNWAEAYYDRADEKNRHKGPLSISVTTVHAPLTLFVMSNTNLKLLDASQVPEKLRKTLTETVGYNKPSGNRYKRVATSSRSDGTKYKTESRNKLQVHTHNFINKANQVDGNYAALSLAKQLKSRLSESWV